jgi:hypothetical protein
MAARRVGRGDRRDRSSSPFTKLARSIRLHRHRILAAIRLGLANGRPEALRCREDGIASFGSVV